MVEGKQGDSNFQRLRPVMLLNDDDNPPFFCLTVYFGKFIENDDGWLRY